MAPREVEIIRGPFERADKARIEEVNVVLRVFDPPAGSPIMVDVGAFHGSSLWSFANKGWFVHAFEPDPTNRQDLLPRVADLKNVRVDSRALGSEIRSDLPFYGSEESAGISSLSAFHDTHKEVARVEVTTLAAYCDEMGLDRIDFLKIDAEGMDLRVLEGVPWERLTPGVVVCEFEDTKTCPLGYDFDDLADFLVRRGYKVFVSEWYPIARYGVEHDWRRLATYPCELEDSRAWGNLLAFQDEPEVQRLGEAVDAVLQTKRRGRRAASVATDSKPPGAPERAPDAGVPGRAKRASQVPRQRWTPRHLVQRARGRVIWIGLLGSVCLVGYGLMDLPGAALVAPLSLLPFVVGIYVRHKDALQYEGVARRQFVRKLETRLDEQASLLSQGTRKTGDLQRGLEAVDEAVAERRREWEDGSERTRALEAALKAARDESANGMAELSDEIARLEAALRVDRDRVALEFDRLLAERREDRSRLTATLDRRLEEFRESWLRELRVHPPWQDDLKASEDRLRSRLEEKLEAVETAHEAQAQTQRDETEGLIEDGVRRAIASSRLEWQEDRRSQIGPGDLEALEKSLGGRIAQERAERILGFARRDSSADLPSRLLLLLAVPRSGSTWFLDTLRCHPRIEMEPSAILFRRLELKGGRYPRALADLPHAVMDFEIQSGVGAQIPVFASGETLEIPGGDVARFPGWSIEKVHPEFFGFDVETFRGRLREVQKAGTEVKIVFQVREPEAVARSLREYKRRDPSWYSHVPEAQVPRYLEKSYAALLDLARDTEGPIYDYNDLLSDLVGVQEAIYGMLWPGTALSEFGAIASRARELTDRRRREDIGPSPFFGAASADRGAGITELDDEELGKCRELYEAILSLRAP